MPNFAVETTLQRYVRGADADEAVRVGRQGVQLASKTIKEPQAWIDDIHIDAVTARQYQHAGEFDVWEVSITVSAVLYCFDELTAREAAHQLVTVPANVTAGDVFEFEVEVDEPQAA